MEDTSTEERRSFVGAEENDFKGFEMCLRTVVEGHLSVINYHTLSKGIVLSYLFNTVLFYCKKLRNWLLDRPSFLFSYVVLQ